ncbi:hypothetical protein AB0L13_13655 [Saccharopolyspora shandongensis]|uniref:hypothetical protein n=1 Tax=Saccharopolyspora shandongensis TaxID=418495 RepID=UPI003434C427
MAVEPISAAMLTNPEPEQPIPKLADEIMSIPDYISPSHWMLIAFNTIFGFNPAEEAAKWFAGDWNGMARAEDAFAELVEFESALVANVEAATTEMFHGWTGEAADAARAYFAQLSQALAEHSEAIKSIAREYHNTAYGVWAICKSVVSTLEMLADILIGIALDLAATALLSETGVGLVVGGAIAGYLAFKANSTWMKVVDLHGKMINFVYAFSGVSGSLVSTLHGMTEVPLPGAPYDNKNVPS